MPVTRSIGILVLITSLATTLPLNARADDWCNQYPAFCDDFSAYPSPAADVDRNKWTSVGWISDQNNPAFFGRTQVRNPQIPDSAGSWTWPASLPKTIGVSPSLTDNTTLVAKLRLDTYNPTETTSPHVSLLGSELDVGTYDTTLGKNIYNTYTPGFNQVSFAARLRPAPYQSDAPGTIPRGMVTSMFAYGLVDPDNPAAGRNEVDLEFLSNHYSGSSADTRRVFINYFTAEAGGEGQLHKEISIAGLDVTSLNSFRINWGKDKIEWQVKTALDPDYRTFYTVTNDGVGGAIGRNADGSEIINLAKSIPDGPMGLRLNSWAPDSSWTAAWDPSLVSASGLIDNQTFIYEVRSAGITVTPEPAGLLLLIAGGGVLALRRMLKHRKLV